MKKTACVIFSLFLLAAPLAAQVTKEDIQKLASAGISDEVILKFIKANAPVVPMSAQDLADLKLAGLGDQVLGVLAEGSAAAAPEAPQAAPESPPSEAVLPPTSYVDYSQSSYSPLYNYYAAPPLDTYCDFGPYYYYPWFSYYYPSWCFGPRWCSSFSFGFPAYSSCFYPWWGGCFASFSVGCPTFGCCFRPFGFCCRPFGSFFPTTRVVFAAHSPRFSTFFAASSPTVVAFRSSVALRNQGVARSSVGVNGGFNVGSRMGGPRSTEVMPRSRPGNVIPRMESRSQLSAPSRPNSSWNTRSFSAPHFSSQPRFSSQSHFSGHWPAPFSHGSSWSGSSGHSGGWGGGSGWGGGGGHHGGHR